MAHEHSHGEGTQAYYVQQIVSVAACGLIAVSALLLYKTGFLVEYKILTKDFTGWVLCGGILLSALVFFRIVGIYLTVGRTESPEEAGHDHGHSHAEHSHAEHSHGGEACDHTDHAHSHGLPMVAADPAPVEEHDHAMAPVRFTVLLIPSLLILVFLGFGIKLPTELGEAYLNARLHVDELATGERAKAVAGKPIQLQFNELARAAIFPKTRAYFQGRKGILRGQYNPINDREFTLYKVDMKCCQADQVLLKARIISSETIQDKRRNEWVKVEGDIQFVQAKDNPNEWVPVLYVDKESQIQPTEPDPQP